MEPPLRSFNGEKAFVSHLGKLLSHDLRPVKGEQEASIGVDFPSLSPSVVWWGLFGE